MTTRIEIFTEGAMELPFEGIGADLLERVVNDACRALSLRKVAITLIVTDNAAIQSVNRAFRKKNAPTDVISFAYRENPFPAVKMKFEHLGDVYLSLEQAKKQAGEYGHSLADEVKRLLVHGVLHLAGYDHERSAEDEAVMRAKEEEILLKIK